MKNKVDNAWWEAGIEKQPGDDGVGSGAELRTLGDVAS
jgi:hypothetical protein